MKIFQPYTTDTTAKGLMVARNAKRLELWHRSEHGGIEGSAYVHRWLCHPERECEDGCDDAAKPDRVALYESPLEDDEHVTYHIPCE